MAEDISRKTVLVLVVLTLVVSVLSLFAVIDSAANNGAYAETQIQSTTNTATGKVYLSVEQPAKPVLATGQVTLRVKN